MNKMGYLIHWSEKIESCLNEAEKNGKPFSLHYDEWLSYLAFPVILKGDGAFLKVKETLTRMGIQSITENDGKPTLYQTCHVLQKKNQYYIVHFKEMLLLDNKKVNMTWNDLKRRAEIIKRLQMWDLIEFDNDAFNQLTNPSDESVVSLKIIPYSEKGNWNLVAKYNIGGRYVIKG